MKIRGSKGHLITVGRFSTKALIDSLPRLDKHFEEIVVDSMNTTTLATMEASRRYTTTKFELKNKWVLRGFKYKKATMSNPMSALMHRDAFMSKQEFGANPLQKESRVTAPTYNAKPKGVARMRQDRRAVRQLATSSKGSGFVGPRMKGTKKSIRYRMIKAGTEINGIKYKNDTVLKMRRKAYGKHKQIEAQHVVLDNVITPKRWKLVPYAINKFRDNIYKTFHIKYNRMLDKQLRYGKYK